MINSRRNFSKFFATSDSSSRLVNQLPLSLSFFLSERKACEKTPTLYSTYIYIKIINSRGNFSKFFATSDFSSRLVNQLSFREKPVRKRTPTPYPLYI